MTPEPFLTYGYALISNCCFGISSVGFAYYSRRISPAWMNFLKCLISVPAFWLTILFTQGFTFPPLQIVGALMLSGATGLFLADIFLLRAYTTLGAGRTLMLFGFQPVIFGIFGWLLLEQAFTAKNAMVLLLLMLCVFVLAKERKALVGSFEFKAFGTALLAALLDALGVIVTRWSLDHTPELGTIEANFYRSLGALLGFLLLNLIAPIRLRHGFKNLSPEERTGALVLSLTGCWLALLFYLAAIQHAHLATLSALGACGPLSAAFVECILSRSRPSPQLLIATGLFLSGIYIVFLG